MEMDIRDWFDLPKIIEKENERSYLEGIIYGLKIMKKKCPEGKERVNKAIEELKKMQKEIDKDLGELEQPFLEELNL